MPWLREKIGIVEHLVSSGLRFSLPEWNLGLAIDWRWTGPAVSQTVLMSALDMRRDTGSQALIRTNEYKFWERVGPSCKDKD